MDLYMSGQRKILIAGCLGLAALGLLDRTWAVEHPRSKIHLTAVHGTYSLSVPWDLRNPKVVVPLQVPQTPSVAAVFLGHVKQLSPYEYEVVGGDLKVRRGPNARTFRNIWEQRLVEVGTVVMPKGQEELYFVSEEGDYFQSWHFNLLDPLTSTLITLSYSWGQEEPRAVAKKSDNYNAPGLADERALLEELARDPDYPIPFRKYGAAVSEPSN